MQFLCRDAYLGAEAELAAVGERRGEVDVDARGIHAAREAACRLRIFGYDGLAVARAVALDMLHGLPDRAGRAQRHAVVEELGAVGLLRGVAQQAGGVDAVEGGVTLRVGEDLDIFCCQGLAQRRQVAEPVAVHDEAVEGVADADTAGLGVAYDAAPLGRVARTVEVYVDDTGARLYDRHAGVLAHEAYEAAPAARDDHVDEPLGVQQGVGGLAFRRQQREGGLVEPLGAQGVAYDDGGRFVCAAGVAASLHDGCVGRLEAEGEDVERDVGPRLADHAHNPERNPHLAYRHAVGAAPAGYGLALRGVEFGDLLHAAGDVVDALRRELEAVVHGCLGRYGGEVPGIGLEQPCGVVAQGGGSAAQGAVEGGGVGLEKRGGGTLRAAEERLV